jgi:hypothetical protein
MVTWGQFAAQNQALADKGERLLFQFGVGLAFIATIRKDGAPRLHPLCPVRSGEGLYVLISPESPKKWDLLKDGRYALQTFPEARKDSDEYYLSGRAQPINDPGIKDAVVSDAKHFASREEALFELLIERAMHTIWEGFGTPDFHPVHTKWSASSYQGN